MGIPEADAVVDLTLSATRAPAPAGAAGRVARRSTGHRPGAGCSVVAWPRRCCRRSTRSWRRLPWKRSRRRAGAPTLTSVSPNQGIRGTTVAVTLTGTNFVVGATTVTVSGGGVTVTNVVVGSSDVADRQLRDRSGRSDRCPHGDGHDGRAGRAARKSSRSLLPRRRARRR